MYLFAAPFLWTAVGCLLMVRGWDWLDPGRGRLLVLAALFVGTLKSLLVLDRVAARAVEPIGVALLQALRDLLHGKVSLTTHWPGACARHKAGRLRICGNLVTPP